MVDVGRKWGKSPCGRDSRPTLSLRPQLPPNSRRGSLSPPPSSPLIFSPWADRMRELGKNPSENALGIFFPLSLLYCILMIFLFPFPLQHHLKIQRLRHLGLRSWMVWVASSSSLGQSPCSSALHSVIAWLLRRRPSRALPSSYLRWENRKEEEAGVYCRGAMMQRPNQLKSGELRKFAQFQDPFSAGADCTTAQ